MTAAGRFRCCQCCRDGEDLDYHIEHGADSHEIPCPTCDASPRLLAKVDDLRAERDAAEARVSDLSRLLAAESAQVARLRAVRARATEGLADEARAVVQRRYYDEGQGYYVITPDDAFVAGARWAVEIPDDTDASRYAGSPGEAADRAALAAPTDTTKEN